jgi:hypothetical protein
MTSDLREPITDVLATCADDHCLVAWIAADIRQAAPALTNDELKRLTIAIVKALLDAGLVQAGIPDGSSFNAGPDSSDVLARRLADHWDLPATHQDEVQYSMWLTATPSGEAVVRGEGDADVVDGVVTAARQALAEMASDRRPTHS